MNYYIDIPVLILLIIGIVRGIRNGLVKELAALIGIIAGIWAGFRLAFIFADYYRDNFHLPEKTLPVIAFLTAFVLALGIVLLLGRLLKKVLENLALGPVDKIAGALFGGMKFAFVAGVLISILSRSQIIKDESCAASISCKPISAYSEGMQEYTIGLIPKARNVITDLDSFFIDLEKKRISEQDTLASDGSSD